MKKFALMVLAFASVVSVNSMAHADETAFIGGWILNASVEHSGSCEAGLYIEKLLEGPGLMVRYNDTTFSVDMTYALGTTSYGNHAYSEISLDNNTLTISDYKKHLIGKEMTSIETLALEEQEGQVVLKKNLKEFGPSGSEQSCSFVRPKN